MSKTVLITGAAAGIGKCLAQKFAQENWNLILWDKNKDGLENVRAAIKKDNPVIRCSIRRVDLSKKEDISLATFSLKFGDDIFPDVIINNAGIGLNKALSSCNRKTYERLFGINFLAPAQIFSDLSLQIINHKTQIVNVSSGQAFFHLPGWTAYSATKVALGKWSEALEVEMEKYGVKVSTVYPFLVNTNFYNGMEEESKKWASKLMFRLMPYISQTPKKVAEIIFEAVIRGERVEMVHPINYIGYYLDIVPTVGYVCRRILSKFLL